MLDGLMACIVPDSSTSPPSDPFTVRPVLVGCQQILIALGTLSNPLKKQRKRHVLEPVSASTSIKLFTASVVIVAFFFFFFFDFPYHNDHF